MKCNNVVIASYEFVFRASIPVGVAVVGRATVVVVASVVVGASVSATKRK